MPATFKFTKKVPNHTKHPRGYKKYDSSIPIKTYELMRAGHKLNTVAHMMGMSHIVFRRWVKKFPELRYAIACAKKFRTGEGNKTFRDYIYGQLSPPIKRIYDKIMAFDKEIKETGDPDGTIFQKLSVLVEGQGRRMRQHILIHAFIANNFNMSLAMKIAQTPVREYQKWKEDPEFQMLLEELNWHKANFFESALIGLVSQGDSACTIFANKTYNRKRGYNEKVDININTKENNVSPLDVLNKLDLPLEVRKELLIAVRKAKENSQQKQLPKPDDIMDAEFEVRRKKKVKI